MSTSEPLGASLSTSGQESGSPPTGDLINFSPLPGGSGPALPAIKAATSTTLTPLVCDERAIARLLATILSKGGISVNEMARRIGVNTQSVRQYLHGRRCRPSLLWFVRFAELAGARVYIEFPKRGL